MRLLILRGHSWLPFYVMRCKIGYLLLYYRAPVNLNDFIPLTLSGAVREKRQEKTSVGLGEKMIKMYYVRCFGDCIVHIFCIIRAVKLHWHIVIIIIVIIIRLLLLNENECWLSEMNAWNAFRTDNYAHILSIKIASLHSYIHTYM